MYYDLVFDIASSSLDRFAQKRSIHYLVLQPCSSPTDIKKFFPPSLRMTPVAFLTKPDARLVSSLADQHYAVAVKGGTLQQNFAAVSTKGVTFLVYSAGSGITFDAAMANKAKENRVAIVLLLSELWETSNPIALLKHYRQLAIICRKKKVPFLVATGARDDTQLRNPHNLANLGALLDAPEKVSQSWINDWEKVVMTPKQKSVEVIS